MICSTLSWQWACTKESPAKEKLILKDVYMHTHRQPQSSMLDEEDADALQEIFWVESLQYLFIINSASMGSILVPRHCMNWKVITKAGLKRRQRTVAFVTPDYPLLKLQIKEVYVTATLTN